LRDDIALAHGARADHPDAEVEISGHSRHHPQLLKILFAEDREIGADLREQLADDGCDPAEEMRPEPIFQSHDGGPFGHDAGGEAVRVHRLDAGIPDQVDILCGEPGDVFQVRG
jgi:hypothetical protein